MEPQQVDRGTCRAAYPALHTLCQPVFRAVAIRSRERRLEGPVTFVRPLPYLKAMS
jgi:hypothetical protein